MPFKTTWMHMRRSPFQALAAIVMTSTTFYVVMMFVMIIFGSNKLLEYFESRPKVLAYFEDTMTLEEINQLKAELETSGKVSEVKYISKEEALAIYKEETRDDPALSEFVFAQTLPASFDISVKNISYLKDVADSLRGRKGILRVDHLEDVTDRLITLTRGTRFLGIVLLVMLVVTLTLIILFVISLRAYIHREEVHVLSLIGASRWFIYQPFLYEALLYGVFAPVIAGGLVYLTLPTLLAPYQNFFADVLTVPINPFLFLQFLGSAIAVGIVTSLCGSFLAVYRYLRF
ncbi:MAG: permease-like cell division protein FtsX [bacterium]|nr:permease-like cell division protein FtsX [bacterium]